MKADCLQALNEARAARRAVVLVKNLKDPGDTLVYKDETVADDLPAGDIAHAFQSGRSALTADERFFIAPYLPAPRLILIGAVHIAQHLAPMALAAEFSPVIIDPRTGFATPDRFKDITVHAQWPEDCLPAMGIDAYTAMAALTHDPKIDDPALTAALKADCFYIGALGSRKTHAGRMERLKRAGFSDEAISHIHAPIGLDIKAANPAEIAVSVMAEIISVLRQRPGG